MGRVKSLRNGSGAAATAARAGAAVWACRPAAGDESAAALLASLGAKGVEELSRCSYAIYLYHGFFLDRETFGPESTALRAVLVLGLSLGLAELLAHVLKPEVSAACFGISPPRKLNREKSQQA